MSWPGCSAGGRRRDSWAKAGKLGVARELIRRRAGPGPCGMLGMHGDLPDHWEEAPAHEVSQALAMSIRPRIT